MYTTEPSNAPVRQELTDTQKAFEFADRLNFAYGFSNAANKDSCSINAIISEYLGPERYKKFCQMFRERNKDKAKDVVFDPFFKEEFFNNPVRNQDILFDWQIHVAWNGLSQITKEIILLL